MVSEVSVPAHVSPHLVRKFNFITEPVLLSTPWEFCDHINEAPDIFYSPELGGHWVVTRHHLVDELLHRPDLFSNKMLGIPPVHESTTVKLIPTNLDPPDHGPYRKLMMQTMFAPRHMAALERDMYEASRAATDAFVDAGHCEFLAAYARPVPIDLFMRMMGLPLSRREQFMPDVTRVFRGSTAAERQIGYENISRLLSDWLDTPPSEPRRDGEAHIFNALMTSTLDGRRLNWDEMLSIALELVLGGLDTVTAFMSHVMHFMAASPAHRQQLVDNPGIIPEAVEELLRRFGISNLSRVVASDLVFHGVMMKAGDMVLYSTPFTSVDRRQYDDPLSVRFDRENKRSHLAFGSGPHFCAGHLLARMELRIMLEEVLPRLPNLSVRPDTRLQYVSGISLAMRELPLVWDPV